MEDTLLDFAKNDLFAVKAIQSMLTGDPLEINMLGYHAQQALEKCFKHQLEMMGVGYKYEHDLNELLSDSDELRSSVPIDLRLELATISKWESKSRYIKGYRVSMNEFTRIFPMIKDYIETVSVGERRIETTKEFK